MRPMTKIKAVEHMRELRAQPAFSLQPISSRDGPLSHLLEAASSAERAVNQANRALLEAKLNLQRFCHAFDIIKRESMGKLVNRQCVAPEVLDWVAKIQERAVAKAPIQRAD